MINPSRIIGAIGLTGGSGKTLDSFPSNMMKNGDSAIVMDGENVIFYICDVDSNEEENSPYIIKPDDIELSLNPEINNKRWIMVSPKYFNDNIIQSLGKYIQTNEIKAIDGQPINFISSEGNVISISTNGTLNVNKSKFTDQITIDNRLKPPFSINSVMKVDNLNADRLDGNHADVFMKKDGSVPFTNPVKGTDPVNDNELTTVSWVENWVENYVVQIENTIYSYIDDVIANIDTNVNLSILQNYVINHIDTHITNDDHIQYAHLDGRRNFTNTIGGVSPISASDFATKGYVDLFIDSIIYNHNDLTNLLDDDHIQYIHKDARRGFTEPIEGKTPITDFHLSTKEYVDTKIANLFSTKDLQIHTFDHDTNEWVMNHNLGNKYVVINFYNKFDNKQIYPDILTLTNDDTAIAEFSTPVNGYAIINGIIDTFNITTNNIVWTIEHSFNRNVIFNLFDENDKEIFPDKTEIIDNSHIKFTFCTPKKGTVVLSNDIILFDFNTPSDIWYVNHTFSHKNLLIKCFNLLNEEILPEYIESTDDNTVKITFAQPESGYVISSGNEGTILDPSIYVIEHAFLRGLNNDDHTQYIRTDGTRNFTGNISGIYPINNTHLSTKQYVDDQISNVVNNTGGITINHHNLNGLDNDDHTQYIRIDGIRGFTEPIEGKTPTEAFHLSTKQYADHLYNEAITFVQRGIINLINNIDSLTISLNPPIDDNYVVKLTIENVIDTNPSTYECIITRKNRLEFDIIFSDYIDSPNYKLNWMAYPLEHVLM
jgi:hypothetical protein